MTRILMVDDEPSVLAGYRRALRGRLEIVTAESGAEGVSYVEAAIAEGDPFAVVVSDMQMPSMNGAQFLGAVNRLDPDAVQLLLSGQADLESTIAAVNDGNLFRMLTKPCAVEDLERALRSAAEQHRLVQAERELLTLTLGRTVDMLTELLALANPDAFAWAERVRDLVERVQRVLKVDDWRLPLATMLSQIGCFAVPPDVLHRARTGGELTDAEREVYETHPQVARRLLETIPRLEEVAAWVGGDESKEPAAQVLQASLQYLVQLDVLGNPVRALNVLEAQGRYPREVLDAIDRVAADLPLSQALRGVRRTVSVEEVRPGMVLEADVVTLTGMVLVRSGERVTEAVAMRLANFAGTVGVHEPIPVLDGV